MTCPHCGVEAAAGETFCQSCGRRLAAEGDAGARPVDPSPSPYAPPAASSVRSYIFPGSPLERPGAVTFLAWLDILFGLPMLVMGALSAVFAVNPHADRALISVLAVLCLFFGLLHLVAGVGLLKLRPWGRIGQIVVAGLWCFWIPIGTAFGVLMLLYMLKRGAAVLFSGRPREELSPEEHQAADDLRRNSGLLIAGNVLFGLIVGAMMAGIVAAIFIPMLLRSRVAGNESTAIGDLKTIRQAQADYATANGGHYDTLECLITPSRCIPDYPPGGPVFLNADIQPLRVGYRFELHLGPPPESANPRTSPSSVTSYAYLASPITPNRTGTRVFCVDSSGTLCAWRVGDPRSITPEGLCPADCPTRLQ